MDGAAADLQEWELLLASPTGGAAVPGPYAGGGGEGHDNDVDAGAIKYDYFDLGSDARYTRRASLSIGGEEETDEEEGALLDASGNASWVEPQPDDLAFPGRDRAALWSDSSSDGERREEAEATEPLEPPPQEEEAAADEGAVAKGGAAPWWKLPMEVLRFWAARAARSAWSLPVAVALLGIAVLGRRLYRMRRQSKAVARFRLVLDEKKASQFKAQPMLRRAPLVKPLLPANGVTPWPVLGHL